MAIAALDPSEYCIIFYISHFVHMALDPSEYCIMYLSHFVHIYNSYRTCSVAVIRNHPLVPHFVPIHGLIIDPVTGE